MINLRRSLLALALLLVAGAAHAQTVTVSDYLNKLFQIANPATPVQSNVTVGTSAVNLKLLDPARFQLCIINLSANACVAKPANDVTTTSGFQLVASGGFICVNARDDLSLPTYEWWAVCAAAGSSLYVIGQDLQ